jgi:hypothetical protein
MDWKWMTGRGQINQLWSGSSPFTWGIGPRLALAGLTSLALWAAVGWALDIW